MTALRAEGCGIALTGDEYEVSVTSLPYVSYGMIGILRIGSLRSPPKGENAEMVHEIYDSLFFSSDSSFPLEGNASKRQRVYKAAR